MTPQERSGVEKLPEQARIYRLDNLQSQSIGREKGEGASCWFPVPFAGKEWRPNMRSRWKTNEEGMLRLLRADRLDSTGTGLYYVRYADDFPVMPISDMWDDTVIAGYASDKLYVVETSTKVVQRCILMATDPGDLVLDPTCGSGTTAYVAEQWGRRWITIDTSRVSIALARTRLMAGRFPYYLLADSADGLRKEAEITGQMPPDIETHEDIKKGFVYERVPHIMLSTIAHDEEIDEIHEKWQPKQDAARKKLNKALKKKWEEWEIPHKAENAWANEGKEAHKEFWRLKRERQAEIDASIARHADPEFLYDRPYEDKKRVRVTGPFTVESLSPHRILSTDEPAPRSESDTETEAGGGQFETMILENLRASGVRTTKRGEGIKFDSLESFAGRWIQGAGEYTDKGGETRRVAVAIGPEHGTVAPQLIKEAAKEAVQGIGFDVLVVCAASPSTPTSAKKSRATAPSTSWSAT